MMESGLSVPNSDAELVQAVLAGNKAAYAELYNRYARLVRAICFDTTCDLGRAQDLSQEVFLRAYRRLGGLRNPERVSRWLVGITRRVCKEWRRERLRDRHRYVGLNVNHQADTQRVCDDSCLEAIREAMLSLPEKERLALHAFYLKGQSADESRRWLGLSRSGLYRVLQRARKRLARHMADYREDVQ